MPFQLQLCTKCSIAHFSSFQVLYNIPGQKKKNNNNGNITWYPSGKTKPTQDISDIRNLTQRLAAAAGAHHHSQAPGRTRRKWCYQGAQHGVCKAPEHPCCHHCLSGTLKSTPTNTQSPPIPSMLELNPVVLFTLSTHRQ